MKKKYRCLSCGERYTYKELESLDWVCPECGEDYYEEVEEQIWSDDYADIPYEERGLKNESY